MTNEGKIQQGLEQDARQEEQRKPVNYSLVEIEKAAKALQDYLKDTGEPVAKFARAVGYSPAVIGAFIKGTYGGDVQKVANKVVNYLNAQGRKSRNGRGEGFIPTTVAKRIGTLITQTMAFSSDEGKIGLVIGDGGHGKSYCLRAYAKANQNAVYVELDQTMSAKQIFGQIAEAFRIDASGALPTITKRLADHLRERHTVLILDEASSLSISHLDKLRQIIAVKGRCPVILAGNADLLKTIMQPSTKRGYESLDQFLSRLMMVLNLDEIALDDDGPYTIEDLRRLYEYGGITLTAGAVRKLRQICKTPKSGRLRTCTLIIRALHTAGVVFETGCITAELIVQAIYELDLPIRARLPMLADLQDEEAEGLKVAFAG